MIGGFGKYLIDNGWKRYREELIKKKLVLTEDNESMTVSTYGPLCYRFTNTGVSKNIYWGLYIKDHPPKFFIIERGNESDYIDTSDYEKALSRVLKYVQ